MRYIAKDVGQKGQNPIFSKRLLQLAEPFKTVSDFANFLGLTRNTVDGYLKGLRLPDVVTAVSMADKLGVTVDYLFGRTDIDNHNPERMAAAKYTGLSESAAEMLHKFSEDGSGVSLKIVEYAIVNRLETFSELCNYVLFSKTCFGNAKYVYQYGLSIDMQNGIVELPARDAGILYRKMAQDIACNLINDFIMNEARAIFGHSNNEEK